ncbi:unnamed protein product, partial [Cyprideis torosa]
MKAFIALSLLVVGSNAFLLFPPGYVPGVPETLPNLPAPELENSLPEVPEMPQTGDRPMFIPPIVRPEKPSYGGPSNMLPNLPNRPSNMLPNLPNRPSNMLPNLPNQPSNLLPEVPSRPSNMLPNAPMKPTKPSNGPGNF